MDILILQVSTSVHLTIAAFMQHVSPLWTILPPDSSTYDNLQRPITGFPIRQDLKLAESCTSIAQPQFEEKRSFQGRQNLLTDRYTPFDIDKENLIGSLGEDSSHITCRSGRCRIAAATLLSAFHAREGVDRNPSRPPRY
jgi:hypothetical protein